MIVNWKFTNAETGIEEEPKEYGVQGKPDFKIITCNFNDKTDFLKLVGEKFVKLSDFEKLVFLHLGNENNKISSTSVGSEMNEFDKVKLREFQGGACSGHPIYYSENPDIHQYGLLGNVSIVDAAIIKENDTVLIKKDNFEQIWDYYWNQLELDYQKKKIIDLFLPLTIDIQGLSEIEKEKKDSYLKEVLTEYNTDYPNKLSSEWKKVKEILAPDDRMEVLGEAFRLTKQEKNKIQSPPFFELLNDAGTENKVKEFIENKVKEFIENNAQQYKTNSKDNTALPVWLKDVVDLIDKKIKKIK